MTQFLNLPGVRIQEVLLSSPPIIGVGTSTAAFVGSAPTRVGTAPFPDFQYTDKVRLLTSADQFINDYLGDISAASPTTDTSTALSRAVIGFFTNGGTACYVINRSALSLDNALKLLEPLNDVSIVAAPGQNDTATYTSLKDHVEQMQNRFAIFDPPAGSDPTALTPPPATDFGAVYYPAIQVGKQLQKDPALQAVTPVGHIAGVYARVDGNRGVFKAPANEVIRGALGVEQMISDSQQNQMNATGKQINALRVFDGNVTVFGARTRSSGTLWLYINVRRLVIYIEQSLKAGLRWAIFEPNNLTLRKQIERSARGFLDGVWRDGALFGATPEEAYYVRFPELFNTPDDQAQGKLTVEIGLRVTYPAEFIIIRIGLLLQSANAT